MELEKSLDVKTPILDKKINTNPITLTTQKNANPNDVKRSSNVEEETTQGYQGDSIPKVNQEKTTHIYQVKIKLQGCLIDILITKFNTSANKCINRNK